MDVKSIDVEGVADLFLLLQIGIGPKIALVPFLEATDGVDSATTPWTGMSSERRSAARW